MTIHRALSELTTLDKRIERSLDKKFVGYSEDGRSPSGYETIEKFKNQAKADYISVLSLIERRKQIKSAIAVANATNTVQILGKNMTVAEALERKNFGIEYDKDLLKALKMQLLDIEEKQEKKRREYARVLETLEDEKMANRLLEERNKESILDPIEIRKQIELLQLDIEDFEKEIDFSLGESNVRNKINIEETNVGVLKERS